MRFLDSRQAAYNLRDSENNLNVPFQTIIKNDFNYSGAILWNSQLPVTQGKQDSREAGSLRQFKQVLKGNVLARHSWQAAFLLNKI